MTTYAAYCPAHLPPADPGPGGLRDQVSNWHQANTTASRDEMGRFVLGYELAWGGLSSGPAVSFAYATLAADQAVRVGRECEDQRCSHCLATVSMSVVNLCYVGPAVPWRVSEIRRRT